MDKTIYDFITDESANYRTQRVPITGSKDWNMYEHIERCTNVSNGWFHQGANDGMRPYKDIVTPIKNVALRSEGFDVKDIVLFVNNPKFYYKSFIVKKYHPQWARKNQLDTFIDDMVESSVVYDLALIKDITNVRPEVVKLQSIAFCDQTDILSGPICLRHQYSDSQLEEFKGRWEDDKIDELMLAAKANKTTPDGKEIKTPGRYNEVFELHGRLPNRWYDANNAKGYSDYMFIVSYAIDKNGNKYGITLFKGLEPKPRFDALKIDDVFGRACGRSLIEKLFDPQVWTNYDEIRIKEMLDAAALVLFKSDSDEYANQKLTNLKTNTVLKLEKGSDLNKLDTVTPQVTEFRNHQVGTEDNARMLGSASEGSLGIMPASGTPFALQQLITTQGQGLHEFNRGKIATFMADRLYPNWILGYLVKDINAGKDFSETLTLDELQELATIITDNEIEKKIMADILKTGVVPTNQERDVMKEVFKADFMKGGNRKFFALLKDELKDIPLEVFANISGKQKNMLNNADKLSNLLANIIKNPGAIAQIPGVAKLYNELIEESGFSPVDFTQITTAPAVTQPPQPIAPVVPVAGAAKPLPVNK